MEPDAQNSVNSLTNLHDCESSHTSQSADAVSEAFLFAGEGTEKLSSVVTERTAVVNKQI